jgi:Na+:H+ antiporter, NhaA family
MASLPRRAAEPQIKRWLQPITRFLQIESASGILLLACTIVALILANSRWAGPVAAFWQTPIELSLGGMGLVKPLVLWINDGLMALFFLVIGLEIKRELLFGELNTVSKALLPIVAAVGGMALPALIYLTMQWGQPSAAGWGIPMATDIAFVVGFLTLLGPRVPHSLKVLLLALAIVDDIGATLVIGIVYTTNLSLVALVLGIAGFGLIIVFQWIGVSRVVVYGVLSALIWLAFVKSGIHPTIAGVALGLLTPARVRRSKRGTNDVVPQGDGPNEHLSPLDLMERALHPWVAYVIMPVFALANAGVAIDLAAGRQPVTLAVAAGLILGKPLGILTFCWLSVRMRFVRMPDDINAKILIGAGCLAGIGFTMSLFIAGLALQDAQLAEAKLGILGGSTTSAILGCVLLTLWLPRRIALAA